MNVRKKEQKNKRPHEEFGKENKLCDCASVHKKG
jgi:hypothetical protein